MRRAYCKRYKVVSGKTSRHAWYDAVHCFDQCKWLERGSVTTVHNVLVMHNVPRLKGSRGRVRRCGVSLSIIHIPLMTYHFTMEVPEAQLKGYTVAVHLQPCRYLNCMWCIIWVTIYAKAWRKITKWHTSRKRMTTDKAHYAGQVEQ